MSSNAQLTLLTRRRHSKWGVASLSPCIPTEKVGLKAGMDKPAWGKVIRVLTVRLSATLKVSLIVQCTIDVLVSRDQHVARGRNLSPVWQHLIVGDGRTQQLGISCIFLESRGVLATTRLFICLESRGMLATTRLEGSWSSHYPCSSKNSNKVSVAVRRLEVVKRQS